VAQTGFSYDGATGVMTFARTHRPVQWFWSTGEAWGIFRQAPGTEPEIDILHGSVLVTSLRLGTEEHAR
jgi:hypothetical protein